jgi:hypothetical protein
MIFPCWRCVSYDTLIQCTIFCCRRAFVNEQGIVNEQYDDHFGLMALIIASAPMMPFVAHLAAADAGAAVPFMYEAPHAQAPLKFQ